MKLLIDSSTNYLYLCLIDNDVNKYFVRCGKNDHSETLVDYLNKLYIQGNQCSTLDLSGLPNVEYVSAKNNLINKFVYNNSNSNNLNFLD